MTGAVTGATLGIMPSARRSHAEHVALRSDGQRLDALRRANEVRRLRAQLKRDLKGGRVSISSVLLDPPDFAMGAKVFDIVLAVPKFGRVRTDKLLVQCRVSPSKTIGGLSQRQRVELGTLLQQEIGDWRTVARGADVAASRPSRSASSESEPDARSVESLWRLRFADLIDPAAVADLLGVSTSELTLGLEDQLVALRCADGTIRYPASQFHEGSAMPALAEAHRTLMSRGTASPWSAASWLESAHPELDGRSPVHWIAGGGDAATLQTVARRDAERLAR